MTDRLMGERKRGAVVRSDVAGSDVEPAVDCLPDAYPIMSAMMSPIVTDGSTQKGNVGQIEWEGGVDGFRKRSIAVGTIS